MEDFPKAPLILAILIVVAMASESGIASGGMFDIIRVLLIAVFVLVALLGCLLIAFLMYFSKNPDSDVSKYPNVTVRRSSEMGGVPLIVHLDGSKKMTEKLEEKLSSPEITEQEREYEIASDDENNNRNM